MWTVNRIDHVVLWVMHLERSLAFHKALGCEVDQRSLERYRQGNMRFVKVSTGPSSAIDLRPDPSRQPVERERGNMQHLNLAIEGVEDYDPDNNRIEVRLSVPAKPEEVASARGAAAR